MGYLEFCLTCHRSIDRTEAIAYDDVGRCILCELCRSELVDAEEPCSYRGYNIYPSGTAYVKWIFAHNDFDGPEDRRSGFGDTIETCVDLIDEQLEDEDDDS